MTAPTLAAAIVAVAFLFVAVPAALAKVMSTGDRIEGADVPFSEPHEAHVREALALANDEPDPDFLTRTRRVVVDELAQRRGSVGA